MSGLVEPEAGLLTHSLVGAAAGAVTQVASNALSGKPLGDGVGMAIVIGGISDGAGYGAGKLLGGTVRALRGVGQSAAEEAGDEVASAEQTAVKDAAKSDSGGAGCSKLSFAADTPVATPAGEQAIGTLKVGDQVTAYDPATGKASTQTVQHVWINHDHDLLDVTLRADAPASSDASSDLALRAAVRAHGSQAPPDETIHTTANHPWLTADRGWVLAGDLHLGERVVRLDGTTATVVALAVRPGVADYYNLTVSQVHTYAVGTEHFVVHNCGGAGGEVGATANSDSQTTRLWRAVEPEELADVRRYGDYNIHPNSTFKRFALDEGSVDNFIKANPDRTYTKTYIDLPSEKLQFMFEHPDPGGVGRSISIDVYETPEFYDWFDTVHILE